MKQVLFVITLFLVLFCSVENVQSEIKDITLLNEYKFIPNKILNSIDFYDFYKVPEIALSLTFFQNELDKKKSSGYLGLNFNAPFLFKVISVDESPLPEFIFECSLDNLEKFKTIIETLSMSSITVSPVSGRQNYYVISSNPDQQNVKTKKIYFPFLVVNSRMYVYGDILSFMSDNNETGIIKEKKLTDKEKLGRAADILDLVSKKSSEYSASKYIGDAVKLNDQDILLYLFTNISGSYLNNLYGSFKLEFLKQFMDNNTIDKQVMVIRKFSKQVKVENFVFNNKAESGEKSNILNFESKINELIESNVLAYFTASGDISGLKKIISDRNIEPELLKEYILKTIDNVEKNIIFYINSIDKAPSIDLKNAVKNIESYPITILFEVSSPEQISDSMDDIAKLYPDAIKIKNNNFSKIIEIRTDSGQVNFYSDFIDYGSKYMILTSSEKELNRLKQISKEEVKKEAGLNSFIKYAKNKKILPEAETNSFYYIDLKQVLKYANKELKKSGIILNNTLTDYLTDKYDNVRGYIKNDNGIFYQNITVEMIKNIDFVQIYNILKSGQNQTSVQKK
ncbi:hypothetical protein KA977_00815 [Candidatus Dependentiae bacterium]|nr:hypothetical protein [Candidatus Dependentiae bacterium]